MQDKLNNALRMLSPEVKLKQIRERTKANVKLQKQQIAKALQNNVSSKNVTTTSSTSQSQNHDNSITSNMKSKKAKFHNTNSTTKVNNVTIPSLNSNDKENEEESIQSNNSANDEASQDSEYEDENEDNAKKPNKVKSALFAQTLHILQLNPKLKKAKFQRNNLY